MCDNNDILLCVIDNDRFNNDVLSSYIFIYYYMYFDTRGTHLHARRNTEPIYTHIVYIYL